MESVMVQHVPQTIQYAEDRLQPVTWVRKKKNLHASGYLGLKAVIFNAKFCLQEFS